MQQYIIVCNCITCDHDPITVFLFNLIKYKTKIFTSLSTSRHMVSTLNTERKNTKKDWFLYVVRCRDQSLYAGITTDLERRMKEHNESTKGARYTRSRRPVELVISWPYNNRSHASKAEAAFKKMSTTKKKKVIEDNNPPL